MSRSLILSFVLMILPLVTFSQISKMKWGKLSDEEIELKECSFDKDADAVVIFSKGYFYFNVNFDSRIENHFRVKVLDESGIKYVGSIRIPYYAKDNMEFVYDLKAQTINVDANGNIVISEVQKDQIFETDSAEWKVIHIVFPDVNVGSVIEYKFTVGRIFMPLIEVWAFQTDIPSLYSEFKAALSLDLGLSFNIFYQGDMLLEKYGSEAEDTWILQNIPALVDEPYISNKYDYGEEIIFQLSGYTKKSPTYNMDGKIEYVEYVASWEDFAKEIMDEYFYDESIPGKNKIDIILSEILNDDMSSSEKIEAIYYYISQKFKWDNKYTLFPEQGLADLLSSQKGSSAEINLMLVIMLQMAGLDAYPVIISTKSNGKVYKDYPILAKFNHMIACVKLGKYYQLLDAINQYRPYNLIGKEDLNYYGFVVNPDKPEWIDIIIPENTSEDVYIEIDLKTEGITKYAVEFEFQGYYAVEQRQAYSEDYDNYISEHLMLNTSELIVDSFLVENRYELVKPFKIICYLHSDENPVFESDFSYIYPVVYEKYLENVFKRDERQLPIDFIYPFSEKLTVRLYLPEGYSIDDKPENEALTLLDNTGKFTYSALIMEGYLKIESKIILDETIFFSDEYKDIKDFYNSISNKFNEPVTIKKKNE